ncbi:hypothetical protein DTO207G8_6232 [Paecilomyces variotii]|nr:hypothetical protein DTO207G8_6232 [Paecilomyces variotii]
MAWFTENTSSFLSDTLANQQTRLPFFAVTGASFALGVYLHSLLSRKDDTPRILASPLSTLVPSLTEADKAKLPIPLDVLPGARDVLTPYGSIRVYEWGPEDGEKVVFVHGITTPCLAVGGIAHELADKGCRVMLFDLFGRGYSDSPGDIPQDTRLFSTQIMLALSSSPTSWTGNGSKFHLVGYSLGGGIAAAFASYFPQLLASVILLAPAGLLRDTHISLQSRLLYETSVIPENILAYLVGRRLKSGPLIKPKPRSQIKSSGGEEAKDSKLSAEDALTEELQLDAPQRLSRAYPNITVPAAVNWQVHTHQGFVQSFMSSMRHGPILKSRQLKTWQRLGKALSDHSGLKILILCGDHDNIIIRDELVEDATAVLGKESVEFGFFDAGHEFPSTKPEEVAERILSFWGKV